MRTFYLDANRGRFTTEDGGSPETPIFVNGDVNEIRLKFIRQNDDGSYSTEYGPHIRTIRASLGGKTAPSAGNFTFDWNWTGGESATGLSGTVAYSSNDPLGDLGAIGNIPAWDVNATYELGEHVSHGGNVFRYVYTGGAGNEVTTDPDFWLEVDPYHVKKLGTGHWLYTWNEVDSAIFTGELEGAQDTLYPFSFVRVRDFTQSGMDCTEIKLITEPLAFSSTYERRLSDPPSIAVVRAGITGDGLVTVDTNAVQSLTIPVEFKGTYFLTYDLRTTTYLGSSSTAQEIEDALNAIYTDGLKRFSVTNPVEGVAYIEFVGVLGALDVDTLTLTVETFEAGAPVISLNTATSTFVAAFPERVTSVSNVPFEIEISYVEDEDDLEDEEVPSKVQTFQVLSTIQLESVYDELADVPAIDWIRPPAPVDYVPWTVDQVVTGSQNFSATYGNGVLTTFAVDHGLGTTDIASVLVVNNSTGAVMAPTSVTITDADTVTVVMPSAPTTNGIRIHIITAATTASFQSHTHTIGQITDLETRLSAIEAAISALEDLVPTNTLGKTQSGSLVTTITMPDSIWQYPGRIPEKYDLSKGPFKFTGKPPALYPAIIDASPSTVIDPWDYAAAAEGVYSLDDEMILPGGYGHKSFTSGTELGNPSALHLGAWVAVKPINGVNAVYPIRYNATTDRGQPLWAERRLFSKAISSSLMRAGGVMDVEFELDLKLVDPTLRSDAVQISVEIIMQSVTNESEELDTIDEEANIDKVLTQKLVITEHGTSGKFGCKITRPTAGDWTASKLTFGQWQAADEISNQSGDWILSARLCKFDLEDTDNIIRGSIYGKLTNATITISNR